MKTDDDWASQCAIHGSDLALPWMMQSRGRLSDSAIRNIPRRLRREHISFNKMVCSEHVQFAEITGVITFVTTTQKCTAATVFCSFSACLVRRFF